MVWGRNVTVSWVSASTGAGSVPLMSTVSSAMSSAAAVTVGASFVPLMVTVRVLEAVPPWPSDAVNVKVSVRLSPTPRPCTAGSALFRI